MRVFLPEIAILNLMDDIDENTPEYMTKEEAWRILRRYSPIDYGNDLEKWAAWVDSEYTSKRRAALNEPDNR